MADTDAELLFVVPDGTTPVARTAGPQGQIDNEANLAPANVHLRDLRRVDPAPRLDREGFELVSAPTKADNLFDRDEVAAVYDAEVRALVKEKTGARRVEIFDHTWRTSDEDEQAARKLREPVRTVHNDYTERSGPDRLRLALPDEADALLEDRFAIVQVWRPIGHGASRDPLALCDGRSLREEDMVRTERRHRDRVGEIYFIAHHPMQRWYFTPDMKPDEAYVFVVYDHDPTRPRFTPHTSFRHDPAAPPRQSLEVRTLAFF